ncbi:MAG: CerR family C-terminal domain-containing protein [Aquabacterium sp.]
MSKPSAPPSRPTRHRADTAYARGEETRRRIIEVALRLFGERGFEGASTREIAQAAGVNAPALQYYFDNKEGVYRACAAHIADSSAAHFMPVVTRVEAVLDDAGATPDQLFEAFGELIDALTDFQQLPDDAEHRRLFMAHEQVGQGPSVLFDLLDKGLRPRMSEASTKLIARYCGLPLTNPLLRMRVMMLFGQVMVFSMGRRSLLTKLGWERWGPEQIATIKQAARAQSRVLMDSWRQEAGLASGSPP